MSLTIPVSISIFTKVLALLGLVKVWERYLCWPDEWFVVHRRMKKKENRGEKPTLK